MKSDKLLKPFSVTIRKNNITLNCLFFAHNKVDKLLFTYVLNIYKSIYSFYKKRFIALTVKP